MPEPQDGKRWNGLFTEAASKHSLGWALRQMSPHSDCGFKTTQREIWEIYNEVYQLNRLPAPHHVAQNGLKNWPGKS